ncbi:hypothetical protein AAC387_Pa05g1315 [Persea americana]
MKVLFFFLIILFGLCFHLVVLGVVVDEKRYGMASAPEEPIMPLVQVNYTQFLINGQLVDATLGKTFPTLYPTTGEVIVHVDEELEFKFVPVNIAAGDHKKERSISQIPFGQAPTLKDGDLKLIVLRAIMKDISHKYTSKGTKPIYRDLKKKMIEMVWMEVEAHQFDQEA